MQDIIKQGQNKNLTKLNLNYDGVKDGDEQAENYLKIVNEKIGFIGNGQGIAAESIVHITDDKIS